MAIPKLRVNILTDLDWMKILIENQNYLQTFWLLENKIFVQSNQKKIKYKT